MTTRLGGRNGMGTIARTSTYTRMAFPHIYGWNSAAHDERSFEHQTQQETMPFSESLGAHVLHSVLEMACAQGDTLLPPRYVS